jgi:hypothetical protein
MQSLQAKRELDVVRREFLLSYVAFATWKQKENRAPSDPERRLSFIALLLAILPEVERICVVTAIASCVANALAEGRSKIDARTVVRYFPCESARLWLGSQRIRKLYRTPGLCGLLEKFHLRLARAKTATVELAAEGFAPRRAGKSDLAEAWRSACTGGRDLLQAIDAALIEQRIEVEISPLLDLLEETARGRSPLLDTQDRLVMPNWAEGRDYRRATVKCPVIVATNKQEERAILRDISLWGLGLEAVGALVCGEHVVVQLNPSLHLEGAVEWVNDARAGVALCRPLHADDPVLSFLTDLSPKDHDGA